MSQILKGKIVANPQTKTAVVEVIRLTKHPRYGKYIKTSKRYKAHTQEVVPLGSTVTIQSTKPISRDKRWRVLEVLSASRAASAEVLPINEEPQV